MYEGGLPRRIPLLLLTVAALYGCAHKDRVDSMRLLRTEDGKISPTAYKSNEAKRQYVAEHPELSEEIKLAIQMGNLLRGMSREVVVITWGFPLEKIYVDPLVQPVSVDTQMGVSTLGAINKIMKDFPGVNTICGLSNISFGLPERRIINRNFLTLAIDHGLNAAILDPTDNRLMATLFATEMLLGKDEYCEKYIDAYGNGRITDK